MRHGEEPHHHAEGAPREESARTGPADLALRSIVRSETRSDRREDASTCLAAFLLWGSPMMIAVACIFFGACMLAIGKSVSSRSSSGSTQARTLRSPDSCYQPVGACRRDCLLPTLGNTWRTRTRGDHLRRRSQVTLKLMIWSIVVCAAAMYAAASVGGAGMQLSRAFTAVSAFCILGVVILTGSTMGWQVNRPHTPTLPPPPTHPPSRPRPSLCPTGVPSFCYRLLRGSAHVTALRPPSHTDLTATLPCARRC